MAKNTIIDVFKHLDILLTHADKILKTRPDIYNILLDDTGVFARHHLPFCLGSLLRLWIFNTHWRVKRESDTVYIYAIKLRRKYDLDIDAYGWSVKEQKVVVIQDLKYSSLTNDANKVGISIYSTNKSLSELLRNLG